MSDGKSESGGVSNAQIMHSIGKLTGMVETMNHSMTARIEDIRSEIRRLDKAQSERMDRIERTMGERIDATERRMSKRIDDVEERVSTLEADDKRFAEKIGLLAAGGGSVSGILTVGVVELIKLIK